MSIQELLLLVFVLGIVIGVSGSLCGTAVVLSIFDRKREVRRLHNLRKVPNE